MKCINCNNEIPDNATFCNMCGQPIQNNNDNNKSSKKLLIILCTIILLVAVVGIVVMLTKKEGNTQGVTTEGTTSKSTSEMEYNSSGITTPSGPVVKIDTSNPTIKYEDEGQRSKNIEFKKLFCIEKNEKYTYAYALMENKNDTLITAKVYINFYKGDQRIGSEQLYAQHVKPHSAFVASGSINFNEEYDRYDISIEGDIVSSVYHDVDIDTSKLQTTKDQYNNLTATYPNETDKEMTYYAFITYYKNGEIVHVYDTIASSVAPGSNASFRFNNVAYDGIEYDNYVVNIQSSTYRDANY